MIIIEDFEVQALCAQPKVSPPPSIKSRQGKGSQAGQVKAHHVSHHFSTLTAGWFNLCQYWGDRRTAAPSKNLGIRARAGRHGVEGSPEVAPSLLFSWFFSWFFFCGSGVVAAECFRDACIDFVWYCRRGEWLFCFSGPPPPSPFFFWAVFKITNLTPCSNSAVSCMRVALESNIFEIMQEAGPQVRWPLNDNPQRPSWSFPVCPATGSSHKGYLCKKQSWSDEKNVS